MTTATPPANAATPTSTAGNPPPAGTPPATIEYKFDPIEGVSLSPEFDADIIGVAKEMGWDQATATKFRAYEAKQAQAAMLADKTAREQAEAKDKADRAQAETQLDQEWDKANREDPEYGGTKHDETSQRIDQLFAATGERGRALLKEMGEAAPKLLRMPQFRGFLAHLAYQMADAKVRNGTPPTNDQPKTFADVAYGDRYPAAAR